MDLDEGINKVDLIILRDWFVKKLDKVNQKKWDFFIFRHHISKSHDRPLTEKSRKLSWKRIWLMADNWAASTELSSNLQIWTHWCHQTTRSLKHKWVLKVSWKRWINSTWIFKTSNSTNGTWRVLKSSHLLASIFTTSSGTNPNTLEATQFQDWLRLLKSNWTTSKTNSGQSWTHTTKQEPNCPRLHKRSIILINSRGNYYVKDLIDVLTEPNVRPSDFIYTKFVTTIILIVPVSSLKEFEGQYELWTENVIPGSARRLGVPEKDGLTIWYHFS